MYSRNKDVVSGSFFLLLALVVFISSFSIKKVANVTSVSLGSSFVPQVVSVLLVIVSIAIIYGGYKEVQELKGMTIEEKENENAVKAWAVVATFVMVGVYVALLDTLGFIIATSVYLFAQFYILADKTTRKLPMFAKVAVVSSVVIYFVFAWGFELLLPAGILG